jgi:hypothetical protein
VPASDPKNRHPAKICPKMPASNALPVSTSYPPRQLIWKTRQPEQFSAALFIWLRIRGMNQPKFFQLTICAIQF